VTVFGTAITVQCKNVQKHF